MNHDNTTVRNTELTGMSCIKFSLLFARSWIASRFTLSQLSVIITPDNWNNLLSAQWPPPHNGHFLRTTTLQWPSLSCTRATCTWVCDYSSFTPWRQIWNITLFSTAKCGLNTGSVEVNLDHSLKVRSLFLKCAKLKSERLRLAVKTSFRKHVELVCLSGW